jgi:dolichol kinase
VKNKKTVEGSIAMFIGSTIVIFLVLLFVGEKHWLYSLIVSLIAGVIGTFVELYTKDGWDTLTLPPVIMLITYLASLY